MSEKIICPHCGAYVRSANYCTQCGEKIEEEYEIEPVIDDDSIEAIPQYSIKGFNHDFVSLYLRIQTIKIKTWR